MRQRYAAVPAMLLFGLLFASFAFAQDNSRPPNILLILADDLGYGDLSSYGAKDLQTPYIDAIVDGGMRFDHFYANSSVCSPTRAALLSGRYPDRVGVPGVLRRDPATNWGHLADGVTLFPAALKKSGYRTAIVGKWHLGHEDGDNLPTRHGFDIFRGLLGGMVMDYYTHQGHQADEPDMWRDEQRITPEGHATDLIANWAVQTIDGWAGAREPFFLYLAFNVPHTPIQPPADWLDKVRAREPRMSDTRAKIVALIEHMDDAVGRVLRALEQSGRGSNTLVVFSSDNGGQCSAGASNGELRGCKEDVYEGGIRVAAAARWPGKIKPGSSSDKVLLSMDLAPTLCEAAGASFDQPLDGRSFLPTLLGQNQPAFERDLYWVRREGGLRYVGKTIHAVRRGDWKLVHNSPFAPMELYNLKSDPTEWQDRSHSEPEIYRALTESLQKHIQTGGAVAWQKSK